jgi:hypothetical protein
MGFSSDSAAAKTAALVGGIGIGAALMYVLDPERGKRRRAMARDRAVALANKTGRAFAKTSRDLNNRAKGVAAEVRSAVSRGEKMIGLDEKANAEKGEKQQGTPSLNAAGLDTRQREYERQM